MMLYRRHKKEGNNSGAQAWAESQGEVTTMLTLTFTAQRHKIRFCCEAHLQIIVAEGSCEPYMTH